MTAQTAHCVHLHATGKRLEREMEALNVELIARVNELSDKERSQYLDASEAAQMDVERG